MSGTANALNGAAWKVFDRKAEKDENASGLRFTDVLFGFVIKDIFTSLANDWAALGGVGRAHLGVASVLVLGSYIGFRNSLKRGSYKLRFFNLPLFLFLLDQGLIFLYFKLATTDLASLVKSGAS